MRSASPSVSSRAPIFNRLALIGMGLIGSSIARAARAQGAVRSIVATARSAATRRRVAELGFADQVVETNAAAVEGADLVIVCIPVGACGAVAAEIGPHLAPGATVSDVGSVKGSVLREMSPHIPAGVHFVPAHPVAGTENSGPDAGFAELFVNRWCILTPPPDAQAAAVERLSTQFTGPRATRRGIVEIGQDSPAPVFGRPHPELPHEPLPLPRPYAAED